MSDAELIVKTTVKLAWLWVLWPMALLGVVAALWNLVQLIRGKR